MTPRRWSWRLGTLLCLAAAVSAAQSPERNVFLGYVEEASTAVVLSVNPEDLGAGWKKNPIFTWTQGRDVFVWTADRSRKVSVDRVTRDAAVTRGRSIEIHLRSEAPIPVGWILASGRALSEQTWRRMEPSEADTAMARRVAEQRIAAITAALTAARASLIDRATYEFFECSRVSTRRGDFLLVAFGTPEEGEFVTRHTIVFRGTQGTWSQLYEDNDLGHQWVADVDGDGVPEAAGATGYNSVAVWKVFPKKSLMIMSSSGV